MLEKKIAASLQLLRLLPITKTRKESITQSAMR